MQLNNLYCYKPRFKIVLATLFFVEFFTVLSLIELFIISLLVVIPNIDYHAQTDFLLTHLIFSFE